LKIHTPPDLSLSNNPPQPILKNVKKVKKQLQEESKEEEIGIEKIPPDHFFPIWIETQEYGKRLQLLKVL